MATKKSTKSNNLDNLDSIPSNLDNGPGNSDNTSGNLDKGPGKKQEKISASALPPLPARIQRISGGPRTGKFAVIVGLETLTVCSRVEAWETACKYNESKGLPRECQMSL